MHTNIHPYQINILQDTYREAKNWLDFFAIAYYPFFRYTDKGLSIESCGCREKFLKDWEKVQNIVADYNLPGKFVTFLGYEWPGNRRKYGDVNVFYLEDYQPLDCTPELPQLYENLRKRNGIAIPHHTAYQVGERGKDWNFHNELLSPFAEIYSSHGSSEGCDTPLDMDRNLNMGPRTSGGTIQEGLKRGYRLGIIASGDNHYGFPGVWGNGLAGVYAEELTRKSIWDAFMKRRVYGVTGDRIKLNFSINEHFMGESFKFSGPLKIKAGIIGSQAIDRVELLRNNQVIHTYCHPGNWDIPSDGTVRAKMKVEFGWGPDMNRGFKLKSKKWSGEFKVPMGRLISVEPCFTTFGQKMELVSQNTCYFNLTTLPRGFVWDKQSFQPIASTRELQSFQALIFEVEAPLRDIIQLKVDSHIISFPLQKAMEGSRILAMDEEIKKCIYEQFHLLPEEIENPDVFWHNAYKVKIHRAIPQNGYSVNFEYVDQNPPRGRNFYYLRVTQLNGQMAWSSPIWVDNNFS